VVKVREVEGIGREKREREKEREIGAKRWRKTKEGERARREKGTRHTNRSKSKYLVDI